MKPRATPLIALMIFILISCRNKGNDPSVTVKYKTFFDKGGMDTTITPGDNFFLYANGKWLKDTKIPPSEDRWGAFRMLYDNNLKKLHEIVANAAQKGNLKGNIEQKVGDLYASGMDTVSIEKLGYNPVKLLLNEINGLKNYKDLLRFAAENYKHGNNFLFGFYVAPDARLSNINAAHFDQTELGLPDRDYYFNADPASEKILAAYVAYIAKLFTLTGLDKAASNAKAMEILKLETAIAHSHRTSAQLRDPVTNYNKFAVVDFQKQVPDINLADIFSRMGLNPDTVLIGQPAYFKMLDLLLTKTPIVTWKDKMEFDVLNNASVSLSKKFRDAHFDFFDNVLSGKQAPDERWETITKLIDHQLRDLLGQLYVQKYFKAEDKKRVIELVTNLRSVFKDRIEKLQWMSPATKMRALEKLAAINIKVGYPDHWETYDDVIIDKGAFYANLVAIARHNYQEAISEVNKPVDKAQWILSVPTVDAFYTPVLNSIDFPAGILQFPYFDKDADDAINYGAVGCYIGHELTHGFDDQGRQYDKNGCLNNWWLPQDVSQFNKRVKVMIDQYNQYTVLNGLHVNGTLTQGENLADNGGIQIAYQAFKNTPEGKSNLKIDGFTPDQRFFLAFAQMWRVKNSDEKLKMRIITDAHSPEMYRVNGCVSNIPAFYKAFNVKPTDKMYRPEKMRVNVW